MQLKTFALEINKRSQNQNWAHFVYVCLPTFLRRFAAKRPEKYSEITRVTYKKFNTKFSTIINVYWWRSDIRTPNRISCFQGTSVDSRPAVSYAPGAKRRSDKRKNKGTRPFSSTKPSNYLPNVHMFLFGHRSLELDEIKNFLYLLVNAQPGTNVLRSTSCMRHLRLTCSLAVVLDLLLTSKKTHTANLPKHIFIWKNVHT